MGMLSRKLMTYFCSWHETDDTQSSCGRAVIFCGGITDSKYSISIVSSFNQ